jgi:5,6-dimethylbenzimidazole synthase
MELWDAIRNRRSCRKFSPQPVKDENLRKIIEAATWAPSPANNQPWEFVILTDQEMKGRLHTACLKSKEEAFQKSGWRWLGKYQIDFLLQAPMIIAAVGDPAKTGVDQFIAETSDGYKYACAAAIQNMLLMAHSLGLAGLWYTLFDQRTVKGLLDVPHDRTVCALICLGKPGAEPLQTPRKPADELIRRID